MPPTGAIRAFPTDSGVRIEGERGRSSGAIEVGPERVRIEGGHGRISGVIEATPDRVNIESKIIIPGLLDGSSKKTTPPQK